MEHPGSHPAAADELDDLFFRLFRLRGVLDPASAVPGLGASVSEVMTLAQLRDQPCSQQALARSLGLEKSTVSRLIDAMTAKGWVERRRDPSRPRFQQVRLTRAGSRAAEAAVQGLHQRHCALVTTLTRKQRQTMIDGVRLLVSMLERATVTEAADRGDVPSGD